LSRRFLAVLKYVGSFGADMRLSDSLRIKAGEVVAFVGAGGKSTAIRRLVQELGSQIPIVVTTTTKIALDQRDLAKEHFVLDSMEAFQSVLESLRSFESVLLTGQKDEAEPKWLGLKPDLIETLIHTVRERGWVLLVEADGARRKSLKVPAPYEPVLPSSCDLVVPVVGLDVIGESSSSPNIHRPEILMKFLDLGDHDRIDSHHVVEILASSQGGLKNVPPSSSVRVLLNKADSDRDVDHGHEIARGLIRNKRIQSVLLASVVEERPVHASIGRVGGVVLAAGGSTRLDGLKQLMTFRGKHLISHAVEIALEGELDPVVVVVGKKGEEIRNLLGDYPIRVVNNPRLERGQSHSVYLGLEALRDQVEAVIFFLADMPLVTSELVKTLVRKHQHTLSPIIAPFSKGRRGNPVLFDRRTFDDLEELDGDRGGRAIFSRYEVMEVEWDDSVLFDVDSEEDLRRMREME
jgi:molybdenum cofactor cytidylyltransferase